MKIAFLSFKALIDANSGAAMEIRTVMEGLVAQGCSAISVSMNCYDVGDDYTRDKLIDERLNPSKGLGQLFHWDANNIRHFLYVCSSKDTVKVPRTELEAFLARATIVLEEFKPDIVIFFGSNELLSVMNTLKAKGTKIVFYLGNAAYTPERKPLFDASDTIIVPSGYIKDYYKDLAGGKCTVIPTTLSFKPVKPSEDIKEARRLLGTVTLINPAPDKGGHVFFGIATKLRKHVRGCLVIESRWTRDTWRENNFAVDRLQNIMWAPFQEDIRYLLNQTGVLLMPSLLDEAAGKVLSEAMAMGIPCVGFDVGGIKEQIGQGGIAIPFDEGMRANPETRTYKVKIPDELSQKWEHSIISILQTKEVYSQWSDRAFAVSSRYEREAVTAMWEEELKAVLAQPNG